MPTVVSRPLAAALAAAFLALAPLSVPAEPLDLTGGLDFGATRPKKPGQKAEIVAKLAPADAAPGDEVTLSVTAKIPSGSHTYSMTASKDLGGSPTTIELAETAGLEAIDDEFTPDHPAERTYNDVFEQDVEEYHSDVTWTRKFRLLPDAKPADVRVTGRVLWQVCDERRCVPMKAPLDVALVDDTTAPSVHEERPVVGSKLGPTLVQAELAPARAKVGETVSLSLTVKLEEGWHVYAIEQPPEAKIIEPTTIKVGEVRGLEPLDDEFRPDRDASLHEDTDLETTVAEYEKEVTWTRRFKVTDADYVAAGEVRYQVCTRKTCNNPVTVAFRLGSEPPARAGAARGNDPPMAVGREGEAGAAANGAEGGATDAASADIAGSVPDPNEGLMPFLVAAVLAGFASLLTPCVFPMVPITVSMFLKQSEKEHHRPVLMASIYAGGIIFTFTAIGVLVAAVYKGAALTQAANDVWLNVFLAGLLVFFGLNLLGMFEIRIPSWLLTWSAAHESKGGVVGVLFMALTFTLVSFTCTFAFVGGLLAWAAQGQILWPVVGMLAFSTAFALPFFFLALFPSMLQKLPKSGGWMNTVKVTMGMIELGAALKFLSVADSVTNPLPVLFDYGLVMSAWMILAVATGLYLLGLFRLPHDTPTQTISVPRFLFATGFLGLALYMAVGLFAREPPSGIIWEQIHAMAPPRNKFVESTIGPAVKDEESGLEYALDYDLALQYARERNLPVFVDFTGVNCQNCRLMEQLMAKDELHQRLEKFVRVKVFTDKVPGVGRSEAQELLAKNLRLQEEYQDYSLPSYAVMTPERKLLSRSFGRQSVREFAEFLDAGLQRWEQLPQGSQLAGTEDPLVGKPPRTVLASQARN